MSIPHYQHYRAGGYFDSHLLLIPQDGDWTNFDFDNWRVITKAEYWRELYQKPHRRYDKGWFLFAGVWHKECNDCGEKKPVEHFPNKRNRCVSCWKDFLCVRYKTRYETHKAEGCVVVRKVHFHIGQLGAKTDEEKRVAQSLGHARYLEQPKRKVSFPAFSLFDPATPPPRAE